MSVAGTVLKGCGFGRTFKFNTANIKLNLEWGFYTAISQYGPTVIYSHGTSTDTRSVERKLKLNKIFPCLDSNGIAEVHVMGFMGDLYGKQLQLHNVVRVPETYVDFILVFAGSFDHRRFCTERYADVWPSLGTTKGMNVYFSEGTWKIIVTFLVSMFLTCVILAGMVVS
jgi:hypothetical protein